MRQHATHLRILHKEVVPALRFEFKLILQKIILLKKDTGTIVTIIIDANTTDAHDRCILSS